MTFVKWKAFQKYLSSRKSAMYFGDSPVCVRTSLLNFNFAAINCHFLWILHIKYPKLSVNISTCFNPIFKAVVPSSKGQIPVKKKTSLGYFFVVNKGTCGSCKPLLVNEGLSSSTCMWELLQPATWNTSVFNTWWVAVSSGPIFYKGNQCVILYTCLLIVRPTTGEV